jgi:hypothetical protein
VQRLAHERARVRDLDRTPSAVHGQVLDAFVDEGVLQQRPQRPAGRDVRLRGHHGASALTGEHHMNSGIGLSSS